MDNNRLRLFDVLNNTAFTIKLTFKLNKSFVFVQFFKFVLQVLSPLVNMYFIKDIINGITENEATKHIILITVVMATVSLAVLLLTRYFTSLVSQQTEITANKMRYYLGGVVSKMKYSDVESPDTKAFISLIEASSFTDVISQTTSLISALINLAVYTVIVINVQPWILLLLIFSVIIQGFFSDLITKSNYKWEVISNHELSEVDSYWYYFNDVKYGKELRVNLLKSWLMNKYRSIRARYNRTMYKWLRKFAVIETCSRVVKLFESIAIYIILAYKVVFSGMSLGDYSFYLGSTLNLTGALSDFIYAVRMMIEYGMVTKDFIRLIALAKDSNDESFVDEFSAEDGIEIEFKNVSFKYPNTENYVLKNVSFKINNGEGISLIGVNGAGKTTIVKLICKFYEPTEGEILINGISTKKITQSAIADLLSIVFQDFTLFSFSVAENVAMETGFDEIKVNECLKLSGAAEKVKSLPNGINTSLSKNFDSQGTVLSGGEGQKIAIARAFYKNSPLIILDEPTAALDPIAEYDIYKSFAGLTSQRTAIYISHRLTTTRFTDKIILLDGGRIKEQGTHAQLMEIENGIYRNMFQAQVQYYT